MERPMPSDDFNNRRSRLLRVASWVCWIPLLSLLVVEWQLHRVDGWSHWATAPLLVVPAMVSLCITAVVAMDFIEEWRNGSASRRVLIYMAVSSSPLLWLVIRGLF